MPDDAPRPLMVPPVVSYSTATTSHATCIKELQIQAAGPAQQAQALALRFRLGRSDAAAFGRALVESADLASRLATGASLPGNQH